jgi:hypothetical protein
MMMNIAIPTFKLEATSFTATELICWIRESGKSELT